MEVKHRSKTYNLEDIISLLNASRSEIRKLEGVIFVQLVTEDSLTRSYILIKMHDINEATEKRIGTLLGDTPYMIEYEFHKDAGKGCLLSELLGTEDIRRTS